MAEYLFVTNRGDNEVRAFNRTTGVEDADLAFDLAGTGTDAVGPAYIGTNLWTLTDSNNQVAQWGYHSGLRTFTQGLSFTINTVTEAGTVWTGIAHDNTTVWFIDVRGYARAYTISSRARAASRDIDFTDVVDTGESARGAVFGSNTLWFVVQGSSGAMARAYNSTSGNADSSSDIDLGSAEFHGGAVAGTDLLFFDQTNRYARAYVLSSRARRAAGDVQLGTETLSLRGGAYIGTGIIALPAAPPDPTSGPYIVANGTTTTTALLGSAALERATLYNLQYRVQGAASWVSPWISSVDNIFRVTGLTPGETYEFQYRGVSAGGNSAWSPTTTYTMAEEDEPPPPPPPPDPEDPLPETELSTPGPPTLNAGDAQVLVTVATVSGATGYRIQSRAVGTSLWRTEPVVARSRTVAGLTNGTEYEFRVQAIDISTDPDRESGWSNPEQARATPQSGIPDPTPPPASTIPDAPPGPTLVPGDTRIDAATAAVTHAERYQLDYRLSGSSTWVRVNGDGPTWTVAALANGSSYDFRVRGVNTDGDPGPWSPTRVATPQSGLSPAPDTRPTLSASDALLEVFNTALNRAGLAPMVTLNEGSPQGIACRRQFTSIYQMMLGLDHWDFATRRATLQAVTLLDPGDENYLDPQGYIRLNRLHLPENRYRYRLPSDYYPYGGTLYDQQDPGDEVTLSVRTAPVRAIEVVALNDLVQAEQLWEVEGDTILTSTSNTPRPESGDPARYTWLPTITLSFIASVDITFATGAFVLGLQSMLAAFLASKFRRDMQKAQMLLQEAQYYIRLAIATEKKAIDYRLITFTSVEDVEPGPQRLGA